VFNGRRDVFSWASRKIITNVPGIRTIDGYLQYHYTVNSSPERYKRGALTPLQRLSVDRTAIRAVSLSLRAGLFLPWRRGDTSCNFETFQTAKDY
jgi:hypothetical protein